jgi:hypothetical protein
MIYGIKENKSFENIIFTYVVDSDKSLADWANNVEGNDYSCVLIKSGTWTNNKGVNLTNSGTKVVIGEVNSKLVFNDVENGLCYDELPDDSSFFMNNVSCEIVQNTTGQNYVPFQRCLNLTNCRAYTYSSGYSRGFANCENLINCYGYGSGALGGSGFYHCNNLINCIGESDYQNVDTNQSGFMSCFNLENCKGIGMQRGFSNCNVLTGCYGVGKIGYGFYSCTGVSRCRKLEDSATATFDTSTCCANISSYNATYKVANTPEGGFNLV